MNDGMTNMGPSVFTAIFSMPSNLPPKTRTIWFVCNGEEVETIAKTPKIHTSLSGRGHVESREIGTFLLDEPISHIITSPHLSCIETAHNIYSYISGKCEINVEPGFQQSEDPLTTWHYDQITAYTKKFSFINLNYNPVVRSVPLPEPSDAAHNGRIAVTLHAVLNRYKDCNILIVAQKIPLAACHFALFGTWLTPANGSMGKVLQTGAEYSCEYFNDVRHSGFMRSVDSNNNENETLKQLLEL